MFAFWHATFAPLYNLWLNSGEYEAWVKDRLLDKHGQVNIDGIKAAKELSRHWKTYYWWFYDSEDPTPFKCPNCDGELDPDTKHGYGKCDVCNIVV